jgi:hypothetical protein
MFSGQKALLPEQSGKVLKHYFLVVSNTTGAVRVVSNTTGLLFSRGRKAY